MSDDLFEFNYMKDMKPENTTSYYTNDYQYIYVNDINNGNYSTGFVNFNNVSIVGSTVSKHFDWSQGYLQLPASTCLELTSDGTNGYAFDPTVSYKHALALKPYIHLIDQATVKFNGVPVNRQTNYLNFYMNETLKTMNTDEYKTIGDLINLSWDTPNTSAVSADYGEYNNNVVADNTDLTKPLPNTGFLERLKRNSELRSIAGVNVFNGSNATQLLTEHYQNGVFEVDAKRIVFNSTVIIPLKYVNDFFGKCPTLASSLGFEMRLLLNIAKENSYTISYDINLKQTGIVANVIAGNTCPFMINQPSADGKTGFLLSKVGTPATASSIKITSSIGWRTLNSSGTGFSDLAGVQCRIMIPTYNFTAEYAKKILASPIHRVVFRDYYFDSDSNIRVGASVSRLFNIQISKARTLYIIPFISKTAKYPEPYKSPLSSAPVTCAPIKLKNVMVQMAGENIFQEVQTTNNQFYINQYMALMSHVNGNSFKAYNKDFGTQINRTLWEAGGYNTFVINLKKVSDDTADSIIKSFQISYTVAGNSTDTYDFMYIIDFDNQLDIDRSSGEIVPMRQ